MSVSERAGTLAGVFVVAAATLMYEILLTRIFSVTMWYHFAFLAVAASLLGMTLGAALVQARPAPWHLPSPSARGGRSPPRSWSSRPPSCSRGLRHRGSG